jgi:hypothetical protein
VQPSYDEVLPGYLDRGRQPDRGGARPLLDGQSFGAAEEPGVAARVPAVRAALGDRVDHLDAAVVRGGDQQGDVGEGARGACLLGQCGQGAVRSDDALLALDGQQDRGRGIEESAELFVRRHGSPWSPTVRAGETGHHHVRTEDDSSFSDVMSEDPLWHDVGERGGRNDRHSAQGPEDHDDAG